MQSKIADLQRQIDGLEDQILNASAAQRSALQQTVGVQRDALLQHCQGNVEVHARSGVPQRDPVRRLQDHTSAAGDHGWVMAGRLDELPGLERTEGRLSFVREDLRDGRAVAPLDLLVEVDEGDAQPTGDLAPDRRLARPGHPDEIDDHGSASR